MLIPDVCVCIGATCVYLAVQIHLDLFGYPNKLMILY